MDKYEYRAKTEQMLQYVEEKSYKKAMEIADTIDWRKVKNSTMLLTVSEIYENNGDYKRARDILFIAYDKAPTSRKIVYRMGLLSLKTGEVDEAMDCYEEFVKMAPKDPNQYILRYKILRAQRAPLEQQIEALEEFKHAEYVEKWAYELAKLYHEAGMTAECLEECDDLILWFSEGKYVYQAMELKMKYKPLTPLQQEKYDQRNAGKVSSAKKKPMFKKQHRDRPAPDPRIAQKIRENVRVTGSINLPDLPEPIADISEPDLDSLPEERPQVHRPRTKIQNTSEIATTITGTNLADVLKTGVAVASGADISGNDGTAEDGQITGQMRIEEILANWEETQRENARIIEKNQEEIEKKKAAKKKEADAKKKDTKSILSDDIRKLMDELENGTEDEDSEYLTAIEYEEEPEEEDDSLENMADVVESLQLSDDDAEEAYEDEDEYEEAEEEEYEDEDEYEEAEEEEYEDEDEYEEADEEEYYDEDEYEEADEEEYYDEDEYEEADEEEYYDEDEEPEEAPQETKKISQEEVLEIEEPSEEEITARMNQFDTGFVVQGRYDLSATSEIGLKAGLTEEQKKLFSYFVPIRGVSEQIVEVLNRDKRCRNRYGTSRTGNIVVVGRKGSGKTVLAVDLVKAIQKQRKLKQGKVAIVTGESLNKKELSGIIEKLNGGAIIIEKAAKMNSRTIRELNELMEEQTGELLFVLEEQRKPLERMFAANPKFKKKFTSRLELPVFINDELVTFGQTYAKENGYRIDEMGILALYSRIDMMQREDHAVTVAEVKDIMDEAIEHSQKANVKHLMKRVFGRSTDETDRIILKEEDFKA
ncbi:MAG TPA: hypothetical protein H9782_02150 [Candidatus Bariatricus faecipullorum]|nr:hypothetical protein [Candidatus Bariatricus faecipullorum]